MLLWWTPWLLAPAVWAAVPDSLVVQGRATTPLATLSGTATIQPSGVSRPFTAQTDSNGVFQFTLTRLSSAAFAGPPASLELLIGTQTVAIPFHSVPFAFRAAEADSLVAAATVQFRTVDVGTMTVQTLVISSATFHDRVAILGGLSIGTGTILMGMIGAGAANSIVIDANGLLKAQGLLTVEAQSSELHLRATTGINLFPNFGSFPQRRIHFPTSNTASNMLFLESSGLQEAPFFHPAPQIRFQPLNQAFWDVGMNLARDFVVEFFDNPYLAVTQTGNMGIGTSSPGAKLEVAGQVKITGGDPGAGKVLTSDASGLASWQSTGAVAGADGVVGNEVVGASDTTLIRSGMGTSTDPFKLRLNLGQANTWTAKQTFNGGAEFSSGTWDASGKVGIGTTSPDATAALTVAGQVKITGGAPGGGKVLTSDEDGLASWQVVSATADADAIVGNEVRDAADASLLRSGSGTAGDPFTLKVNTAVVTTQGNAFNAANQLVKLDGQGKLPAVDGSQLTNIAGAAAHSPGDKHNLVVKVLPQSVQVQADFLSVQGVGLTNIFELSNGPVTKDWHGLYVVTNDTGSVRGLCIVPGTSPLTSGTVAAKCGVQFTRFRRVGWANAHFKDNVGGFLAATSFGDWWDYEKEPPDLLASLPDDFPLEKQIIAQRFLPPTSRRMLVEVAGGAANDLPSDILTRPAFEFDGLIERRFRRTFAWRIITINAAIYTAQAEIWTNFEQVFDMKRVLGTEFVFMGVIGYYDPV